MATEQAKTLQALRIAVKMEIDGKEYYLKTSQTASSKMGEKLLRSMSQAEDAHRKKFIDIYEAIRDKKAWPRTALKPAAHKNLNTIFATATRRMAAGTKPLGAELDAVKVAMKMENKTLDFYTKQAAKATGDTEKSFYKLSYGMFIVCSKKGDKVNGQVANTVFQITSEPPTIAVSINKNNFTHGYIDESKVFTASVLSITTPLPFIGGFGFRSGKVANKLAGVKY